MQPTSVQLIDNYLMSSNDDITKILPRGRSNQIAADLNLPVNTFRNGLYLIKKRDGIIVCPKKTKQENRRVSKMSDLRRYLLNKKLVRGAPNKEQAACETMIDLLQNRIPTGGGGMIIGTPSVVSASKSNNYSYISCDNLEVALALKWNTSVQPTLVIGNAVSPEKAKLKAEHWAMLNSTNKFNIILDTVYRDSFTRYVSQFAEKNETAKVILMMSGAWGCVSSTEAKYKMSLDFKSPSEYLISQYPGLHIIAMTREGIGFNFNVRYLHRGKNEIV